MKRLIEHIAAAEEGRADAMVARLLGWSRARVRGLIDHGGVTVNGQIVVEPGQALAAGAKVAIHYDPERQYRQAAPRSPLRSSHGFSVVFCDDAAVVVVKEAGLLTVPTPRGEHNTLLDRLSAHLATGPSDKRRVAVVHRLDRETSGLLIFGRTPADAAALIAQFAARKPEREYVALVKGRLADDKGTISSRLATDKGLNQRSTGDGRGELAITHYEVTRRFADATEVRVRLETGRRNQIRAHFAEAGHPVLGDQRYRPELAAHPAWPHARLALHAQLLGCRHPRTGAALRFTAPLPGAFTSFYTSVAHSGTVDRAPLLQLVEGQRGRPDRDAARRPRRDRRH